MIDKRVAGAAEAVSDIFDGATIMIGGFGEAGSPIELIHALIDQGATNLTMISNNCGSGEVGLVSPDVAGLLDRIKDGQHTFDAEEQENLRNIAARRPPERPCYLVSAHTGEGVDALLSAIEDRLAAKRTTLDLSIDAADGAGISWLHRNAEVLTKELHDGRFAMTVRVD